jgi:hypothetical protein
MRVLLLLANRGEEAKCVKDMQHSPQLNVEVKPMRVIRINADYSVIKRGAIGVSYGMQEFLNILSTYKNRDPFFRELRDRYELNSINRYVLAFKVESMKDDTTLRLTRNIWNDWVFFTTISTYETVDMKFEDPFSMFRVKTVDGGLL